jgi:hypothetical protein
MNFADVDRSMRSVKLFPRLAMTNQPAKSKRSAHPRSNPRGPLTASAEETPRAQVRARLLRMILENERVRRSHDRPNAG